MAPVYVPAQRIRVYFYSAQGAGHFLAVLASTVLASLMLGSYLCIPGSGLGSTNVRVRLIPSGSFGAFTLALLRVQHPLSPSLGPSRLPLRTLQVSPLRIPDTFCRPQVRADLGSQVQHEVQGL